MSYLVDTNVVSELRKGKRCDSNVATWFANVAPEQIHLSALTIGELRRGIESVRRRDPASALALDRWLAAVVHNHADRILPIELAASEEWGRLNAPDPLPVIDSLLAATAIVHGLTLVTRNVRDVERSGVRLLNPFAGQVQA